MSEQYKGYKNLDGNKKKQKALPLSVLRKMHEVSYNKWEHAVTQLLVLAIFFAMRSCEFLQTSHHEESKRTKIIRLKNIIFKKKGRTIQHSANISVLSSAELVILTFEFQKNEWRNHSVHMWNTNDNLLCPVKAAANIVKRVQQVTGYSNSSKICSYQTEDGKVIDINSSQVLPRLRSVVSLIGEHILGFSEKDIGLHSIRSGGAMAMFLSGISTIIIQRVGRWSSEAFLEYIREQVESFTFGVSQKMLNFEHFHNLNEENDVQMLEEEADVDIFKGYKGDGQKPIDIEHQLHFSELSLHSKPILCF